VGYKLILYADKTSYFPGFPAFSVVPGPEVHRVANRPGRCPNLNPVNYLGQRFEVLMKGFKIGWGGCTYITKIACSFVIGLGYIKTTRLH
jgi:hypothetical protein